MDSDDDYLYDATDSGNESPEEEDSEGEQVFDWNIYQIENNLN